MRIRIIVAMRFLAFAYTYHYLNWLSKTRIINWHSISRARLSGILIICLAADGSYVYDYEFGLMAVGALSFMHVVLEFPLNMRSLYGIYTELRTIGSDYTSGHTA